jgi:hypothetical protein
MDSLRPILLRLSYALGKHSCWLALSWFLMLFSNDAVAGDLFIKQIVSPPTKVEVGRSYPINILFANQREFPVRNIIVDIHITSIMSGKVLYMHSGTINQLDAFSEMLYTAPTEWIPLDSGITGNYGSAVLSVTAFSPDDVDTTNNSATQEILIFPPPDIMMKFPFSFSQASFINPVVANNTLCGTFTVTYPPLEKPMFVNVMARENTDSAYFWLVRNMPLLPFDAVSTVSYWVDLSFLKIQNGYFLDSLMVSVKWTDSVLYEPFEVHFDTTVSVNRTSVIQGVENGPDEFTLSFPVGVPDLVTFDSLEIVTWDYRGCKVPNIDLDSTKNHPDSLKEYGGDWNACGPAAAANSLQWLEEKHPKIPLTLISHREKMKELSKMMKRQKEKGVTTEQLVEGKLAFIDKYRLPIKVKFQSVFVGDSTIKSPNNSYGHEARNFNKGNKTPPTWDWLKQEMANGEDVEILFGWYDSEGKRNGGHWVTVTGISEVKGAKGLYFKDDSTQGGNGGTREQFVNWVESSSGSGWSRLTGLNVAGYYPWVESVVSESYDPTVEFDVKPDGINTLRFFDIFAETDFIDVKKGEVGFIVEPSSSFRILNAWLGSTKTTDLFWVCRNVVLMPFDTTQRYTFFFDYSYLKINKDSIPDSLRIAYKVTDEPISDTNIIIKDYKDMKVGITDVRVGNGSADTAINMIPSVSPSLPGLPEGWQLRAYVYRGCNVPNIDLDSSRNHPGTVTSYAGDKNACGPAAAANSLEWLASTNSQLNPGNTHREKLQELSRMMKRANNSGVMRADFIKAKLDFIDKYKLPIRVKFQGFYFGTNDIPSPNTTYGHSAQNKNDSANKPPKWEWLVQEMQHGEDVELEFGYYDNTGTRRGGHWITVTGVSDVAINRGIYFKDDLNQRDSGGLRSIYVNWKDTLGYSYLVDLSSNGYTCWIETIVSESYDTTVKFDTRVPDNSWLKSKYELEVVPNPGDITRSVDILFTLDEATIVRAELFDLNGAPLKLLYSGLMEIGKQKLTWDCTNNLGSKVSQGIYLLRLTINGVVITDKIVIE